ncbi:MAG: protein kinase [Planctomycetes bacterium]|nr:protein kinase [Planctomycetota bacterium]
MECGFRLSRSERTFSPEDNSREVPVAGSQSNLSGSIGSEGDAILLGAAQHDQQAEPTAKSSIGERAPSTPSPLQSFSGQATMIAGPSLGGKSAVGLEPGDVVGVGKRYELVAKIGQGGMGAVYRAKDLKLGRVVALKRMIASGDQAQERFRREAEVVASLGHPNVVTILDFDWDDFGPYIAMEFVQGKPLDVRLREGKLPLEDAIRVFEGICRGVACAHKKGVIHRDIKPANVLLAEDETPKLLDFGLARDAQHVELSMAGHGMGTIDYAAPEQKRDATSVDHRADIFSLGVTFYEILTGVAPPIHDSMLQSIPGPLRRLISKATHPDRNQRFSTADDLLSELKSASQSAIESARRSAEATRKAGNEKEWQDLSVEASTPSRSAKPADTKTRTNCPSCGARNKPDAKFCKGCGAPFTSPCPACSKESAIEAKFCDFCGADRPATAAAYALRDKAKSLFDALKVKEAAPVLRELQELLSQSPKIADHAEIAELAQSKLVACDVKIKSAKTKIETAESAEAEGDFGKAIVLRREAATQDSDYAGSPLRDAVQRLSELQKRADAKRLIDDYKYVISWHSEDEAVRMSVLDTEYHAEDVVRKKFESARRAAREAKKLSPATLERPLDAILVEIDSAETEFNRKVNALIASRHAEKRLRQEEARVRLETEERRVRRNQLLLKLARKCAPPLIIGAIVIAVVNYYVVPFIRAFREGLGSSSEGDSNFISGSPQEPIDWSKYVALRRFEAHSNFISASRDGKQVLTVAGETKVSIWDTTGVKVREFTCHTNTVCRAVFSIDGKQVLTASWDKTARIWDAATGKEIRKFEGHTNAVSRADFSSDGKQVLTASYDNTARLWDAATGKEIRRFVGHEAGVQNAVFSPDGRQVLTASYDGTARLWDAAEGKENRKFVVASGGVFTAVLSPNGKFVLTASGDNTVRLWDAATSREILKFEGHKAFCSGAVFSPDGKQVLTASDDNTARLWDAVTGKEIRKFEGHTGPVYSAVFSPDDNQILTASADGTAILWGRPEK